jgi:hypothetical protein
MTRTIRFTGGIGFCAVYLYLWLRPCSMINPLNRFTKIPYWWLYLKKIYEIEEVKSICLKSDLLKDSSAVVCIKVTRRIRIRIKETCRIRIRINVMRVRNTGCVVVCAFLSYVRFLGVATCADLVSEYRKRLTVLHASCAVIDLFGDTEMWINCSKKSLNSLENYL